MRRSPLLAALSLAILAAEYAAAGDVASLGPPEVEMPVLKGRLLVRMPKGAKDEVKV